MGGVARIAIIVVLAVFSGAVPAQNFPDRPVRFIVPFPPGGGTDGFARALGATLSELRRQQVIVDNRGGAQGNIGTALGAKANKKRDTPKLAHQRAVVVNPHRQKNCLVRPKRLKKWTQNSAEDRQCENDRASEHGDRDFERSVKL